MSIRVSMLSVLAAVTALAFASQNAWAGGGRYHGGHGDGFFVEHSRHGGGHGFGGHHGFHGYGYHDDGDDLLFGLLVGGVVGYALGQAPQQGAYADDRYPPATGYPAQPPYPAPSYGYQPRAQACLQEREYQTTVIVGGREVEAYGTACLQPDGSWRRGPARLAAY